EADYYAFTAPTTGSYRINATTPSSNLDTVLGVFSSSGSRLAYNDDISSSNRDSQLSVTLTAGGRYFVGVSNYTGTPGGSYSWLVDGPPAAVAPAAYAQNDAIGQATPLGTLTAPRTVGGLIMADAADWFSFTTSTAGTSSSSVTISFQNAQGNLALELYN